MTRSPLQPSSPTTGTTPAHRLSGRRPGRRSLVAAGLAGAAGVAVLAAGGIAVADAPAGSTGGAYSPETVEESLVHVQTQWTGYVGIPGRSGLSWSDPVTIASSCTGWFASTSGHIMTAGHCVDPAQPEVRRDILAAFLREHGIPESTPGVQNWRVEGLESDLPDRDAVRVVQPFAFEDRLIAQPTVVHVLDFQPAEEGDLALLQASGLGVATPALAVTADQPATGDAVTAAGYPANVAGQSDYSRLRASFKSGTISSANVSAAGVPGWEVNADLAGGMSGGPTVDAGGAVVGVNSSTFVDQSFNFVTDTAALRSFLDQHHVTAPVAATGDAEAPVDGGQSAQAEATAATAGGDAALAGGVVDPASASVPAPDGATSLLPYAAAGALLVLGAGGAYQHTRRRPAGPAPRALPGGADATRLAVRPALVPNRPGGRPVTGQVVSTPRVAQAGCTHAGNPAGARFCQGCGGRLGS